MTTSSLRGSLVHFLGACLFLGGCAAQPVPSASSDEGSSGGESAAPSTDAGGEYAGSFVRRTCGPADGPAFQLDLFEGSTAECTADDTRRTLGFYVHDLAGATIPPSAGTTIAATAESASGTANRCTAGTCESSESWTLTFDTFVDGTGATGTYSVTWADGSTSTGRFDASWCSNSARCG